MASDTSCNLPIPASSKEITPDWVKRVTGHIAIPESFYIEGDIQEGIGFLSSICRVSYKTENGDKHDIIVKMLPTNPKWLEFALCDAADEREIKFYSIILPDLLEVVPEIEENVCKYFHGGVKPGDPTKGTNRTSMLVMQDLKALGYQMMDFSGDASEKAINGLITFMARLHFGALAVEITKGIPLPELYPFMQGITYSEEWMAQVETMSDDGFQILENLLTSNNISKQVWTRYEKLKPYSRAILDKVDQKGKLSPCLIHGDVWPPNTQVHDSLPVKLLDWQLLGYRDVTYDLSVMLYTVLPKEHLTTENLRRFLRRYYNEFEQLCKDKGYETKIKRRTWEEFENFFFTWGIAFGYLVFLPSIECYGKNYEKYANVFRVMCEENNLPEFLLSECT